MQDAPHYEPGAIPADPPSPNGHEPTGAFEAKLLADLDGAIRERRDEALGLEAGIERTKAKLVETRAILKRYEDLRKRLMGEPLRVGRPSKRTAGPGVSGPVRKVPSKMGPEKLAEVRAFVLAWAEDHEEFRQVDVRSAPGTPCPDSGKCSSAFEALRQDGTIRLARSEGNNKWYRLTRSAHRAENLALAKGMSKGEGDK